MPQASQACKINNGPYKCNLGDYKSPFREDNDNPVAPAWFRKRQTSDADGLVPLPDPIACQLPAPASSCQSAPKTGFNPNRFFGIDAQKLDPQWYHLDGFMSSGVGKTRFPCNANTWRGTPSTLPPNGRTSRTISTTPFTNIPTWASMPSAWTRSSIRSIPALYYGEKIEFMKGKPQDIDGPNMTIDQTGRAYSGDNLEPGTIGKTKSHPLYGHIKRLNMIRRSIPALQKAPMSHVNEFGSGMSFVRDYNNGQSCAVVGLAMGGGQNFTVGNVRNGVYRDAVTGNTISVSNVTLSFPVKANSAGIYVLDGPGKIDQDGVYLK